LKHWKKNTKLFK